MSYTTSTEIKILSSYRYNESNPVDIFDTRNLAAEEEYLYDKDENEDEQGPYTRIWAYTQKILDLSESLTIIAADAAHSIPWPWP